MGLISSKKLSDCEKITVSSFCRRRLPVVLVRLKFAETLKEAVTFVEQGRKFIYIYNFLSSIFISIFIFIFIYMNHGKLN